MASAVVKPTPQNFERFIPWVLTQMQAPMLVFVKRMSQVEYEPEISGKKSMTKIKSVKFSSTEITDSKTKVESINRFAEMGYLSKADIFVVMTAYYDKAQNLSEIAFIDSPLPIHNDIFTAISYCFPYHSRLTRFTYKGNLLNRVNIYQIAKILPFSNFTDIILDHTNVPQGNYYMLLDQATTLKYLSLSGCEIDDDGCKEIADRIELGRPAAKSLVILNLSINQITDIGAQALGHVLRTNRQLLHLNLCNNRITSVGAVKILHPLTEFRMDPHEISEMKKRKQEYVTKMCLKDITNTELSLKSRRMSIRDHKTLKLSTKNEKADKVATPAVEYDDTFDPSKTVHRNGIWYCNGNLHLCSLNLAYNDLDFSTVKRIVDVLHYQNRQEKKTKSTGLMRVVIEGNCLPTSCVEYDLINMYLNTSIPLTMKKKVNPPGSLTRDKSRIKRE